jgi:hypothetical protein
MLSKMTTIKGGDLWLAASRGDLEIRYRRSITPPYRVRNHHANRHPGSRFLNQKSSPVRAEADVAHDSQDFVIRGPDHRAEVCGG